MACVLAALILVVASTAVASAHSMSAGRGFAGHMGSIGRTLSSGGPRTFGSRSFAAVRSAAPRFAAPGGNFPRPGVSAYSGVTRPAEVVSGRTFRGATGTVGGRIGSWGGGYWRGSYWPRAYYRVGIPWILPVLPAAYLTFWWGGLPYYYYDDAYYMWSAPDQGYVLTTPPPADDAAGAGAGAVDDLYAYPRNGQSDAQQAQDRQECEQWATSQGAGADYRRAIAACLEGRDYSVR